MKIKETVKEVFSEIWGIGMLVILFPFLVLISIVFAKDQWVRGNGE